MTIKAIVELTLQPDKRDEFVRLFEGLMAQHRSMMQAAGWHGTTMYAVVGDPDKIIEIGSGG